jgi:hypothetical protein
LHSALLEHEAPRFESPHELLKQWFGVRHWASTVQTLKHLVPLHTYGLQASVAGVTQRPAPSQFEGGV